MLHTRLRDNLLHEGFEEEADDRYVLTRVEWGILVLVALASAKPCLALRGAPSPQVA